MKLRTWTVNHHTLAAISIAGTCLDVMGSLYLAYDLLGGQHGPLRLITRAVTYSIVFGVGYALGLGLWFGIVAGLTTGFTIAIELNRAASGLKHYSLALEGIFAAIRGVGFAAGLFPITGLRFAAAFWTDFSVLARNATGDRLCGNAEAAIHEKTILGNGGADAGIHCVGAGVQCASAPRGSCLGVCVAGRIGYRNCHRDGPDGESIH
jgi:hypothetical protein